MLAGCLLGLGVLGTASVALSVLERTPSVLLSIAAMARALQLAWRELGSGHAVFCFRADGSLEIDAIRVDAPHIVLKGPLTWITWWVDGRARRWAAWPDVVDAPTRRELRLWCIGHRVTADTPAVAR